MLSLFLLTAYYKFLGSFPLVAVGALLLYVGSYQVTYIFTLHMIGSNNELLSIVFMFSFAHAL